jgi:methylated-DNA-[protein]-cysteine S-methyltransferase
MVTLRAFIRTVDWADWATVGVVHLAATDEGIVEVGLGGSAFDFSYTLRDRIGISTTQDADSAPHAATHAAQAAAQLAAYFARAHHAITVPIDYRLMSAFQRTVYEYVRGIAAGRMDTYQHIAEQINNPRSTRAVGGALARNPIPIIIPCHRVIGADGTMVGYSGGGGIDTKRRLLQLEGAVLF